MPNDDVYNEKLFEAIKNKCYALAALEYPDDKAAQYNYVLGCYEAHLMHFVAFADNRQLKILREIYEEK